MSNKSEVTIDQYIALGTKYLYSKKYKKSLKEFTKAYNIDNHNKSPYMSLIASLIRLNKNKEAIEKVKEIIKINPKDADIYPLYATSLIRIGDLLNAVEQYRIASELDDKYWRKYNNLKKAVDVIVEYNTKHKL